MKFQFSTTTFTFSKFCFRPGLLQLSGATSFMNGIFKTNFSSPQVRFHTFYINSYMDSHTTSVKLCTGVRIRYANPLSRYDRVAICKLFERPWFLETSRGIWKACLQWKIIIFIRKLMPNGWSFLAMFKQ